jgi:hypothetical protein
VKVIKKRSVSLIIIFLILNGFSAEAISFSSLTHASSCSDAIDYLIAGQGIIMLCDSTLNRCGDIRSSKPSSMSDSTAADWCGKCEKIKKAYQVCANFISGYSPPQQCQPFCSAPPPPPPPPPLIPKFEYFYPNYTGDSDVYLDLKKKSKEIGSCEKQVNASIGSDAGVYTNYIPTCRTTMPDIRKSQVQIQNFMSKSLMQSKFIQNASQLQGYLQNTKDLMDSFASYLTQWNSSYTVCLAYYQKSVCRGWNALGVCWKGYHDVDTSTCRTYSAPIYPNRTAAFLGNARTALVSQMQSLQLADANFKLIQSAPGFTVQENSIIGYVKKIDLAALNRLPRWLLLDSVKFAPPISTCKGKGTPVGVTMGISYSYMFLLNWLQNASLPGDIITGGILKKNIQSVIGVACAPMRSFYFGRDAQ